MVTSLLAENVFHNSSDPHHPTKGSFKIIHFLPTTPIQYYLLVSPSTFPFSFITPGVSHTDQLHLSAINMYLGEQQTKSKQNDNGNMDGLQSNKITHLTAKLNRIIILVVLNTLSKKMRVNCLLICLPRVAHRTVFQ